MQKNGIVLDKSSRPVRFVGRHTTAPVPRYFLYGETEPTEDWFVNVEPLDQRCRELGWVIQPHAHPRFMQLMMVFSGGGTMSAEGELIEFIAPAILVVPTHAIHGFDYLEGSTGWVLTVADQHLATLADRAPELGAIWSSPCALSCIDDGWIEAAEAALNSLDRELDEGAPGGVIAAEALLTTILVAVLRQFSRAGELGRATVRGGYDELVARFRAVIEDHYSDNLTISEFADRLNVSVAQLRAACLRTTGQAPLKLVHERILIEAKRNLIYSVQSIAQIAYALGFDDPAYFSRFFTRATGTPPARFRQDKAINGFKSRSQ
jgi:AraC family transcriptional activator of pobA